MAVDISYEKEGDYTLRVTTTVKDSSYACGVNVENLSRMTRIFNFAAQQITTVEQSQQRQYSSYSQKDNSSSVSSCLHIQNFHDVASPVEIELMHAKLVALGGNPPALDTIAGRLGKTAIRTGG